MWPARKKSQGATVTIQVGEMKSKDISMVIGAPEDDARMIWILVHQNDLEGSVELRRAAYVNDLITNGQRFHIIDFGAPLPSSSLRQEEAHADEEMASEREVAVDNESIMHL